MSLRARLQLLLVGLVAAGLLISDVVTYTSIRSFLLNRIDPQLDAASFQVGRELLIYNGLATARGGGPGGTPTTPAGTVPSSTPSTTAAAGTATTTTTTPSGTRAGGFAFPGRNGSRDRFGIPPVGTFGVLIHPDGTQYGKATPSFTNDPSTTKAVSVPKLPHPFPKVTNGAGVYLTVPGSGSNPVTYRVLARRAGVDNLVVVVAIPLTDVNQTLGRLLAIELVVTLVILVGLGVLAGWIVRRGLRPLEDMAEAADEIAAGDLGRRVAPAEARTEVGRLGLSLNAMLEEIEEAFSARAASEDRLRRFLADASHELRTPLTSIRGYAEIFDLGASQRPADLATSMRHIREESDRMTVLVNDLLLLAQLDQERPLDLSPIDIVPVVATAVTAARVAHPDHPIELDSPEVLEVGCDGARVRQVLDNLLANAVRHSPPDAPVEVRVSQGGGEATVEVADEGPGVAAEDAERIFEPFYRADRSRARRTGGVGLGLAIVDAIARAHGGSVGVRDNPGGGACFWFRLPVSPHHGGPLAAPTGSRQVEERPTTAAVD